MSNRKMSVAGTFYPHECSEIKRYLKTFCEQSKNPQAQVRAKAIISPHAGYVYSGFTANTAYSMLDTSMIKRVIVIGPSHRVYIKGASIALYEKYESPCSSLSIDIQYSQNLIDKYDFLSFEPSAHNEHSTETQIPFIEHYFNAVQIVEIVYGDINYKELARIIDSALDEEETFVVISTDLSHFYTLQEANRLDEVCLKAVEEMDLSGLESGCEACGMIGVKAVVQAAKKKELSCQLIDYRTSFDASSDASSVVGYMSVLVG